MAVSDAVLHVKGTDGVVREITLYTTPDDIVGDYKEFGYKGETVYAAASTDGTVSHATELRFKGNDGVERYITTKTPMEATTGTVSISGALSVDMVVNGNLTVSGAISSNVVATGTISYGSLTGTAKANSLIYDCDIQVSGGTLSFDSAVSESDGAIYTTGRITNPSGVTTTVYGRLAASSTSNYPIYNNGGTFIVADGGYLSTATSYSSSSPYGRSIYNTASSAEFVLEAGGEIVSNTTGAYADGIYQDNSGAKYIFYGKVTSVSTGTSNSRGMTVAGGQLNIEAGAEVDLTGVTYGIYNNGATITVSGHLSSIGTGSSSNGIYSTSTFTTEEGSEVEAIGVAYGIRSTSTANFSGKLTAEGTGTSGVGVYASGGTMNIYESAEIDAIGYLYGLQANSTFNNYGTLVATISSTASSTYAVYQNSTFTVYDGGSITAKGGDRGWNNNGGTMTLNAGGAIVTEGSLYGLYATGTLNLYGTIEATGATADFYCTGTTNLKGGTLIPMEA